MRTDFLKKEAVEILVESEKPSQFAVKIRKPYWATNYMLTVNGDKFASQTDKDGFIVVERNWEKGDLISFTPVKSLHAEALAGNDSRIAILYGPLVLAGDLGQKQPEVAYSTPVLLTDNRNVNDWVEPVNGKPLHFKMKGVGKPFDPELQPFYQTIDSYYGIYWDFFSPADWATREKEYEIEKERSRKIKERTIDEFRIGEMQPERDHDLKASANSYIDAAIGVSGREARSKGFFSFNMKVDPELKNNLLLSYIGDDKNRKFDIKVDGEVIKTITWDGAESGKFYDFEYEIDHRLTKGKTNIRIAVEANYGKTAGRIFSVKIVK